MPVYIDSRTVVIQAGTVEGCELPSRGTFIFLRAANFDTLVCSVDGRRTWAPLKVGTRWTLPEACSFTLRNGGGNDVTAEVYWGVGEIDDFTMVIAATQTIPVSGSVSPGTAVGRKALRYSASPYLGLGIADACTPLAIVTNGKDLWIKRITLGAQWSGVSAYDLQAVLNNSNPTWNAAGAVNAEQADAAANPQRVCGTPAPTITSSMKVWSPGTDAAAPTRIALSSMVESGGFVVGTTVAGMNRLSLDLGPLNGDGSPQGVHVPAGYSLVLQGSFANAAATFTAANPVRMMIDYEEAL